MTKSKRGTCVNISPESRDHNEFFIHGHELTQDEITDVILAFDMECNGEFEQETRESFEKKYKFSIRKEWGRWGFADADSEDMFLRMLYDAKPNTRGAFAYTIVRITNISETENNIHKSEYPSEGFT